MGKIGNSLKSFGKKLGSFIGRHKILSILLGIVLLALIINGVMRALRPHSDLVVTKNQIVSLEYKDVTNAVNETGSVVSSDSVDVYAEKQLPLVALHVKEGDVVEKGDIIAELDARDIKQQIAQKEAAAAAQSKSLGAQISAAKNRLQEAISGRKNGTNPGIQGANSSLVASFDAYKQAKKVYEDYKKSLDEGYHPELIAEKSERENLSYQESFGNVKYTQLRDDLEKNAQKSMNNRSWAGNLDGEITRVKRQIDSINKELSNLEALSAETSSNINEAQEALESLNVKKADLEKQLIDLRLRKAESGNNPEISQKIQELESKIASLEKEINKFTGDVAKKSSAGQSEIYQWTQREHELKNQLAKLTEDLARLQGDRDKYLAEADALDKEREEMTKVARTSKMELEKAHTDAQLSADKEVKNAKARKDQLKTYKQNMEVAKNAYDEAVKALEGAKVAADNEISNLRDGVNQAQAGKNNMDQEEIKFLTESLDQTLIKAPVSGTVTQVKAKVGQTPVEALVRVETVNTLRVDSHIKEYNINDVHVGTKVILTSDAVEGEEFVGEVLSVAPGPEEKIDGSPSKDVYYKTTISIKDTDMSKLAPGMTVRVKYILSQEKNTFSVPTDAVFERENKQYVLTLKDLGKDQFKIVLKPVIVGLSNDFETSIKGEGLKEKMKVLTTSQGYGEGQVITVTSEPKEEQDG